MTTARLRPAILLCLLLGIWTATPEAHAAGTLTPVGAVDPLRTLDHRVEVSIDNGFARTEVHQTFSNPSDRDLEAIFRLPLPKSASLSEMTILAGERELHGEVLPKDQAEALYEEEKNDGNDAGLGVKNDLQSFDFHVYPVPAGGEATVRFVYYQPIALDTGVGRYLYPLEDGGTEDAAVASFWTTNPQVDGTLSIEVDLQSAWPLADVRVPGFETAAEVEEIGEDRYRIRLDRPQGTLDSDFVVYYRLEADLPGRVEMLTHRPDPAQPGTFLMVLTPALDLQPLQGGRDFVFVLDRSGSMAGKLGTLARGVGRALDRLDGEDRFRIVTFDDRARHLVRRWTPATPENVAAAIRQVEGLGPGGSTNLHAGLDLALRDLDDDRATAVVLVTDGVANSGVLAPKEFAALVEATDVRIFGLLLGNSANWPLMEIITDASGGFYAPVSNQDDILGQLLLAEQKVAHESLHDAELTVRGEDRLKVFDLTGKAPRKIYRGQQLMLFGRYDGAGPARVRLDAKLTGEDKTYTTRFDFPERSDEHPELERLWALGRIEDVERRVRLGLLDADEGAGAVEGLGIQYQLVTDETSMVVLDDLTFEEHGIERRNRARVASEDDARARRVAQPIRRARMDDADPMFGGRSAPSLGNGGGDGAGAFGGVEAMLLLVVGCGLAGFVTRAR